MNGAILNTLKFAAVLMTLCMATIAPKASAQNPQPPSRQDSAEQLLYHRAFEVALWAMPAADSFATREAVKRDLHGKPNDVAINTRPLNSDAHLIALQTQTPYLQGALDLRDGAIVVEIPLPPASPSNTERSVMLGSVRLTGLMSGKVAGTKGKAQNIFCCRPTTRGLCLPGIGPCAAAHTSRIFSSARSRRVAGMPP